MTSSFKDGASKRHTCHDDIQGLRQDLRPPAFTAQHDLARGYGNQNPVAEQYLLIGHGHHNPVAEQYLLLGDTATIILGQSSIFC